MLLIENLSKSFGCVVAISGVSLNFTPGSLTSVIGPNGAGKTTFFNLIMGTLLPDKGRILRGEENICRPVDARDRSTRHCPGPFKSPASFRASPSAKRCLPP